MSGLVETTVAAVERAITLAAEWRASQPANRRKAYWKGAMDTLGAMLVSHGERITAVEQWAERAGRTPLRLALAGAGCWRLYLAPEDSEALVAILGKPAHVAKATVTFEDAGAQVEIGELELLRSQRGEQVVHDWPAASDWLGKEPTHALPFDRVRALVEMVRSATAPEPGTDAELLQLVADASSFMRKHSKGSVRRMDLVVPIGFGLDGEAPQLLTARIDALAWAHTHGGPDVKVAAVKALDRIYASPQRHIEALTSGEPVEWTLLRWHVVNAWQYRADLAVGIAQGAGAWLDADHVIDPSNPTAPKDRWIRTLAVTAVTPAGVALVPWLAGRTRAAIE